MLVERLPDTSQIIGIDLQEVEPIAGADIWMMDFLSEEAEVKLMEALDGPADLVLSDMANSSTGHRQTDQIRTMSLCEAALDFAIKVLAPGGNFAAKVLAGGADNSLMTRMQQHFKSVKHAKPPSSRAESKEWFVVARGFKGNNT